MPRYYFIIQTPDQQIEDDNGCFLPNDGAAMVRGLKLTKELARAEGREGWCMIVKDHTGRVVSSIPLQQALH